MTNDIDTPGAAPDGPDRNPEAPPAAAGGAPAEPRGPTRTRWVVAAMGALAVVLFAVPLLRGPGAPPVATGTSGTPAAGAGEGCTAKGTANLEFTLTDMKGVKVRLSDYRGKVILLNFWATWCGPCKVEIPDFVDVYARYRDKGLVILGVLALDEPSAEELHAFASEFGMNYPVFRANEDFEAAHGPIWGLPTTFVIDRHGSICTKHMGPVTRDVVEREIKALL